MKTFIATSIFLALLLAPMGFFIFQSSHSGQDKILSIEFVCALIAWGALAYVILMSVWGRVEKCKDLELALKMSDEKVEQLQEHIRDVVTEKDEEILRLRKQLEDPLIRQYGENPLAEESKGTGGYNQ